jgi:hypothetical protein
MAEFKRIEDEAIDAAAKSGGGGNSGNPSGGNSNGGNSSGGNPSGGNASGGNSSSGNASGGNGGDNGGGKGSGSRPPNLWIVKPVSLSRGRGISLISDVGSLAYTSRTVVQRYLNSPLLLSGHKFDLRLYVLVTSFEPLEAFLYEEGFARLSTVP